MSGKARRPPTLKGDKPKPGTSGNTGAEEMSVFEIKVFKLRKHQKRKPICTLCKQYFPNWCYLSEHSKKSMGAKISTSVMNVKKRCTAWAVTKAHSSPSRR